MLLQLSALTLVLALAVLPGSSAHGQGAHVTSMRRRRLNPRAAQPVEVPVIPKALPSRMTYTKSINTALVPSVTPSTLKGVVTEAFTRTNELGKRANGDIQKGSFTDAK